MSIKEDNMMNTISTQVRMPEELWEAIRFEAAQSGNSANKELIALAKEGLAARRGFPDEEERPRREET